VAAHGKIISGITNCQSNCAVLIVNAQFTNVAGCVIQAGKQRVGDPWFGALEI